MKSLHTHLGQLLFFKKILEFNQPGFLSNLVISDNVLLDERGKIPGNISINSKSKKFVMFSRWKNIFNSKLCQ